MNETVSGELALSVIANRKLSLPPFPSATLASAIVSEGKSSFTIRPTASLSATVAFCALANRKSMSSSGSIVRSPRTVTTIHCETTPGANVTCRSSAE